MAAGQLAVFQGASEAPLSGSMDHYITDLAATSPFIATLWAVASCIFSTLLLHYDQ
jgi:hypothetical protein